jgi:hypothetical protein
MADDSQYGNVALGNQDITGDRSFLTFFHDTGVQIYTSIAAAGLKPLAYGAQRTLNIHCQAGNGDNGSATGLNFSQSDDLNTFLKKGFPSETNFFTVTSIGFEALQLGIPTTATSAAADGQLALNTNQLAVGPIVQGVDISGAGVQRTVGSLFNDIWASLCRSASVEFSQDGRKSDYLLGSMDQNPSGLGTSNDASRSSNGLPIFGARRVFPRGLIMPPRSANSDGFVFKVNFNAGDVIVDPTQQAVAGEQLALVYRFTMAGYMSDRFGTPIDDPSSVKSAQAAAVGQPVVGK